mmetsp:Transcript_15259/g.25446  ORF Transcript_15259/g.25446 Transcript_15259/m.25446 type:complete len:201 (+) Transcript_15259:1201-1803(+)
MIITIWWMRKRKKRKIALVASPRCPYSTYSTSRRSANTTQCWKWCPYRGTETACFAPSPTRCMETKTCTYSSARSASTTWSVQEISSVSLSREVRTCFPTTSRPSAQMVAGGMIQRLRPFANYTIDQQKYGHMMRCMEHGNYAHFMKRRAQIVSLLLLVIPMVGIFSRHYRLCLLLLLRLHRAFHHEEEEEEEEEECLGH